jgi:hypothetical protein
MTSTVSPFRLLAAALVAGLLLVSGCDFGDFGDINDDPTRPNELDPDLLFARATTYGPLRYNVYQRSQHLFGNLYVQYFANLVPAFPTGRYESGGPYDDWATSFWNGTYAAHGGIQFVGENVSNSGVNVQQVIRQTQDDPEKINQTAMARIWKVWLLHRITDVWGDVPYSEAFGGLEGNRTPAYDPQEEIYTDMLSTLESAASNLDPSITGERFRFGDSDLIYEDDVTQWRKFANSLRLRLAMRLSEVRPELAEQHVSDVLNNAAIMESNDDSAQRPSTAGGEFITQNPLSIIASFNDDRVSETVVTTLRTFDDPRLPVYADTIVNAPRDTVLFRGLPNGLDAAQLSGIQSFKYSRLGDPLRAADHPTPILLYPEVKFLEAEAALRGWGPGNARDHYEDGIRASLAMYGFTNASTVETYLEQPEVAWNANGTFEEQLEQIITQKWIAIFTQGFEAWAEYRRTGYPELIQIPNAGQTNGQVPTRILYPNTEKNTNEASVREAAQRIGGDAMTTTVWWDVDS